MSAIKFSILDVRPILQKGSDPLTTITGRMDALVAGQGLTVIAPFLPAPLIERMKGEGYAVRAEHRDDGGWAVNFWRD